MEDSEDRHKNKNIQMNKDLAEGGGHEQIQKILNNKTEDPGS